MFISKLFFCIALINMTNCSSSQSNKKIDTAELEKYCQSFSKAICTKDTTSFYRLVDKEKLTISMSEWITEGKKPTQDDLYFPFFFIYSPLKIRHEELMIERNKEVFFKAFKVENIETITEDSIKVNLNWTRNISSTESQQIELILEKGSEWKVTGAKWKTL